MYLDKAPISSYSALMVGLFFPPPSASLSIAIGFGMKRSFCYSLVCARKAWSWLKKKMKKKGGAHIEMDPATSAA